MSSKNKPVMQWFANYGPFVVGLLALIAPIVFRKPFPSTLDEFYDTLGPAGVLSIIAFLISDRIAASWQDRQNREILRDQFDRVRAYSQGIDRIFHLGSPGEAIAHVTSQIKESVSCWNTYISYGPHSGFGHSIENHRAIVAAMKDVLSDGDNHWIDIVSDVTDDFIERIREVYRSKPKGIYRCYRLNTNFPAINFILIDYGKGRRSDITFGWGKSSKDDSGDVFYTDNDELVKVFKSIHIALRDPGIATEFDPLTLQEILSKQNPSIVGWWFIGDVMSSSKHKDHIVDRSIIEEMAIIQITRARGRIEMFGWTFDEKGVRKKQVEALAARENGRIMDMLIAETGIRGREPSTYAAFYELVKEDELRGEYFDVDRKMKVPIEGIRIHPIHGNLKHKTNIEIEAIYRNYHDKFLCMTWNAEN